MSKQIGTGCGSFSCLVRTPTGQGVNGPCMCDERELKFALINIVPTLKAENTKLTDKCGKLRAALERIMRKDGVQYDVYLVAKQALEETK